MATHKLYIRFRDSSGAYEIYRSPAFKSKVNLLNDYEKFDDLVVDGDDDEDFFIPCDMEGHNANIIWLMFEPYDAEWVATLYRVWKKHLGFELPTWDQWTKIPTLDEAYT